MLWRDEHNDKRTKDAGFKRASIIRFAEYMMDVKRNMQFQKDMCDHIQRIIRYVACNASDSLSMFMNDNIEKHWFGFLRALAHSTQMHPQTQFLFKTAMTIFGEKMISELSRKEVNASSIRFIHNFFFNDDLPEFNFFYTFFTICDDMKRCVNFQESDHLERKNNPHVVKERFWKTPITDDIYAFYVTLCYLFSKKLAYMLQCLQYSTISMETYLHIHFVKRKQMKRFLRIIYVMDRTLFVDDFWLRLVKILHYYPGINSKTMEKYIKPGLKEM